MWVILHYVFMTSWLSSFSDFTDDIVIAQAYTFLSAGFDTTSTLLQFILFELSRHPDIQEKARAEVVDTLAADGDKMSYQTLANMKYLDHIINGTT